MPGAGRKSARDERLVALVIDKCWQRVRANLEGKRLTDKEKDFLALEVVKRTAPKNIDLTSKGEKIPVPIYGGNSTIQLPGHDSNPEGVQVIEAN